MSDVDHFVWYPLHGKGYQDDPIAMSGDYNPLLYTNMFKKEFVPIVVSYSKRDFMGYMLFNKPDKPTVLFTQIFHKVIDEYGRRGIIHHSAIIKKSLLEQGNFSLLDVGKAMEEYDRENKTPVGKIDPLRIPDKEEPRLDYKDNIQNYLSKAAVETLATRIMMSARNRTSFRCLGADKEQRLKLAVYLVELLNFDCGIRPISFTTEYPTSSEYYELFNLTLTERAAQPDANAEDWAVINWDLDMPVLPRMIGQEEAYRKLDEAFS